MILTKDNLLRFVREKKAVTPAMVGETFETSTMIASAALSELAKEKLIAITKLKLSSTPYYYDPKQKEYLIELGEKHFSKYEKEIFLKLKEQEILNNGSLTIQESLAIERIQDFAIPIEINTNGNELKFWVWYLRDIELTKQQINEALNQNTPKPQEQTTTKNKTPKATEQTKTTKKQQNTTNTTNKNKPQHTNNHPQPQMQNFQQQNFQYQTDEELFSETPMEEYEQSLQFQPQEDSKNEIETFIEQFLKENYFKIENKNKEEKGILYSVSIKVNTIEILMDCFYFYKKTNEAELIKFYTASQKPKIAFITNCPKKLYKLSENIENLTIVNI